MPYARTRTRGSLSNATYTVTDYGDPLTGGVFQSKGTVTALTKAQGEVSTMSDNNNGNFEQSKSRGVIVMSPCSLYRSKRQTTSANLQFGPSNNWGTRIFSGEMAAAWAVGPTMPSWYTTRITDSKYSTITNAHAKVADSDFQGLVSIAEAKKTAASIAGPFKQSLSLVESILKRKLALMRAGLTAAQAAAKAWNEYRFGWKPLFHDISGMMDAYTAATRSFPVRLTARSSNSVDYNGTEIYAPVVGGLTSLKMSRTFSCHTKISSGVLYQLVDFDSESAARRKTGTRLSDIPAAVWELVPYSFVVDRFLTIGNWLKAVMPKPGVQILGSWTTTTYDFSELHTIVEAKITHNIPPSGTRTLTAAGGSYYAKDFTYVREVNPSLPISPAWNPQDLGLQQQIDHFALIYDKLVSIGLSRR